MNIINFYLLKNSFKYIFINIIIVTNLILFINIIEISRILDNNLNINTFLTLSILKIPSIISDTIYFIVIIAIAFLYRNLISNNELISMRNVGFSIIDIYKPVAISIFSLGIISLIIINPLSAIFEKKFNEITSKENTNIYSIKFINNGMWIKNVSNDESINFINILEIDLDKMTSKNIKILNINGENNKIIFSESGIIRNNVFTLFNATIYNIKNNKTTKMNEYNLTINFNKKNIIDSLSNYKFIPFYNYYEHVKNLKKFNLHSPEISLFYISEIFKPFFLVIIGFVVMGFSGKFKRNENFFKVLFLSVLIGFVIFLMKEIIINITANLEINYILSYITIFTIPIIIGLYQMIGIEKD